MKTEKQPLSKEKPEWASHEWPWIVQTPQGYWFGLSDKSIEQVLDMPTVSLIHDSEILAEGPTPENWKSTIEVRPLSKFFLSVTRWLMRENHTFIKLPSNNREALSIALAAFDEGQTYASVFCRSTDCAPNPGNYDFRLNGNRARLEELLPAWLKANSVDLVLKTTNIDDAVEEYSRHIQEARRLVEQVGAVAKRQNAAFRENLDKLRNGLSKLPRHSFVNDNGGVRKVEDALGSWVDFNAVQELFDFE